MLHEVYRFGTQIQDLCRKVSLNVRSLRLQSANLPNVFEWPSLNRNSAAFHSTAVAVLNRLGHKVAHTPKCLLAMLEGLRGTDDE